VGDTRAKALLAAIQGPDGEGAGRMFPVPLDNEHAEREAGEQELDELVELPRHQLCI